MATERPLRRGWTTGTCATAAAKAAFTALLTGAFPDPVEVTLPRGERPRFALAMTRTDGDGAAAGVVKDAGDDPDVTHGALVCATVAPAPPARRHVSRRRRRRHGDAAGPAAAARRARDQSGAAADDPQRDRRGRRGGESRRRRRGGDLHSRRRGAGGATLNGRLGIVGGLSILGTTGIVVPYSCAAWIHSIHRGIDVARAPASTISPAPPAQARKPRCGSFTACRRWR